jgi:hypothetical protein
MARMRRTTALSTLLALTLAVVALAGCGGDDDSTSTGGNSASPADQILADAGLEVCSEDTEQILQSTVGADFQAVRSFAVAKSCGGAERTPNTIRVFQFGSREAVDNGSRALQHAYPNGVVMQSGALVIVVTGPQREANADAVGKAYEDSTGEPVETV